MLFTSNSPPLSQTQRDGETGFRGKLRPRKGSDLLKASRVRHSCKERWPGLSCGVWAWCPRSLSWPSPSPGKGQGPGGSPGTRCATSGDSWVAFLSHFPLSSKACEAERLQSPGHSAHGRQLAVPAAPGPPTASSGAAPLPAWGRAGARGGNALPGGSKPRAHRHRGGRSPGPCGVGAGSVTRESGPEPLPGSQSEAVVGQCQRQTDPGPPRHPAPATPPGPLRGGDAPLPAAGRARLGARGRGPPPPAGFPRLPRAGRGRSLRLFQAAPGSAATAAARPGRSK